MRRRRLDEPVQSDRTILMTVEDLIGLAMNTSYHNVVNFKLVQTILHILARQLRLLEQHVMLQPDSDEDLNARSRRVSPPRRGRRGRASLSPPGRGASSASKRSKSAKRSPPEDSTTTDEGGKKERKLKGDKEGSKTAGKVERSKSARGADDDSDQDAGAGRRKRGERSRERRDEVERKEERGGGRQEPGREDKRGTLGGVNIREKDKVLVAEKGPRRAEAGRVGSIEVATAGQLEALREDVRRLQRLAGPPPPPALPSDPALREGLAAGTASLTDTFHALQLSARVAAAEEAAQRLAEMVTVVAAAAGAPLPAEDLYAELQGAQGGELSRVKSMASTGKDLSRRKSVMVTEPSRGAPSAAAPLLAGGTRPSLASRISMARAPGVTKEVMEEALEELRDELMRNMSGAASKAGAAADLAALTAKNVAERLEVAERLAQRITTLQALVADYAEQLSGFGGGLDTQMSSFQEQMASMRGDLTAGLVQLEQVNSNKETLAVMELTERYAGLVVVLDATLHEHGALAADMRALADQLEALRAAAESLGEQKADRDEVADGLRDKADLTRLAGLLPAAEYATALDQLEQRLALCHRKFSRQEAVWQTAMGELNGVMEGKADLAAVLAAREEALRLLRALQYALQRLELAVGEPKAAVLTRAMARDAGCASCGGPALMELIDVGHGAPPRLPALRPPPPPPPPPGPPCEWEPLPPNEDRAHACHRWVGGSHTLLGATAAVRGPAHPLPGAGRPARQYLAAGDDGRLYKCEEELQPCRECNEPGAPGEAGERPGAAGEPAATAAGTGAGARE